MYLPFFTNEIIIFSPFCRFRSYNEYVLCLGKPVHKEVMRKGGESTCCVRMWGAHYFEVHMVCVSVCFFAGL